MAMTEEELQAVERQLRGIVEEAGLDWVIEQVDEWIAEDSARDVDSPPRYSYNSWNYRAGLGEGYQYESVEGWKAPTRAVTLADRPAAERLVALIDALHRVLTEPPAIEREMLRNLAPSTELRMAPVASVSFIPDQDQPEYDIRTLTVDSADADDVADGEPAPQPRTAAVLEQLRALAVRA
jgi:hypothetical protein